MGTPLQKAWQVCEPKKMLTLAKMWACKVSAILKLFPHQILLGSSLDFLLSYILSLGEETFCWEGAFIVIAIASLCSRLQETASVPPPFPSWLPSFSSCCNFHSCISVHVFEVQWSIAQCLKKAPPPRESQNHRMGHRNGCRCFHWWQ